MTFFLGFITGAAAMALVLGLYDVLTRDQIEEPEFPEVSFNHIYPREIILDRKKLIDNLNKMYGTGCDRERILNSIKEIYDGEVSDD